MPMLFDGVQISGGMNFEGAPAVTSDPYFYYNSLLLPGNGTNNGTNNTFIDGSTNNFTITRNGNTTQGTFSPFSQTGWSNYFDGSGDYLTYNAGTSLSSIGTGPVTIEAWVYFTGNYVSGYTDIFIVQGQGMLVYQGYLYFYGLSGIASSTQVPRNSWVHLAVVRESNFNLKGYINGSEVFSTTSSTGFGGSAGSTAYIGSWSSPSEYFPGYISNLRVSNIARYTANFTPSTTNFTSDANTALLTCQSNRFIDNSTNNFSITRIGDVSVQSFSPFNPTSAYSTSTVGGSGYFDGTGDNLLINYNSALHLSGDFTIECWLYPTATGGIVINFAGGLNIAWASYELIMDGSNINFAASSANSGYDIGSETGATGRIGTLTLNAWNHIAVTRSSNTYRGFLNGVQGYTQTLALTPYDPSARGLAIGGNYANTWGSTPANVITGYVSSVRIVKGTAVYTSNFTPPTTPLTTITNTSLLCNFTNGQITDATSKGILETAGDAKISTAQSKFGGSSMYFDGTGDYLTAGNNNIYNFGPGDFTIEAWINPGSVSNSPGIVGKWGNANENWLVRLETDADLRFYYGGSSVAAGYAIPLNVWTHIAISRQSGTLKIFINGTEENSTSVTTNLTNTTALTVGAYLGASIGNFYTGYINDLRITTGYARYTTSFTPPTQAFPVQ